MPVPSPLDAVIFDLDGVLLDSERVFAVVIHDALRAMGFDSVSLEMTQNLHARMMGLPGAECDAILQETFGLRFCSDRFRDQFLTHVEPHFQAGVPLKAGALELLDALDAAGIPKAVATSSARSAIDAKTPAVLRERFSIIIARDDVERGKPHPDPFLTAARRLGARPRHCVAFEDSHNGIRSAHAAGMATIMVPDLLAPSREIAALCSAIVGDLDEARRLLGY